MLETIGEGVEPSAASNRQIRSVWTDASDSKEEFQTARREGGKSDRQTIDTVLADRDGYIDSGFDTGGGEALDGP